MYSSLADGLGGRHRRRQTAALSARWYQNGRVARVEWTRIEPGDIEQVVAILLCRENPAAVRPRPSRGDGGIDILVPLDGTGTVAVYQVKSFTSNLTPGQKAQAERSFRRLMDYAAVRGLRVAEWYLTMPLNPTNENLQWLEGFTASHGLLAQWRGLDFLEGLAADYPSVIDYYLRDGKDRLQAALESLTTVLRTTMRIGPQPGPGDPAGALEPAEAMGTLAALHDALNEHDPHFAYDYSVDTVRPEVADQPGLVAAVQEGDGKRWVTIKVLARCAESLTERPVPLSIRITAEPGSDLERDLEAFGKYGTLFTAPTGTTDAEIALPGGLGGTVTGGSVRIEARQALPGRNTTSGCRSPTRPARSSPRRSCTCSRPLPGRPVQASALTAPSSTARSPSRCSSTSTRRRWATRCTWVTSPASLPAWCFRACGWCGSSGTRTGCGSPRRTAR
jgi:hypothetical protein